MIQDSKFSPGRRIFKAAAIAAVFFVSGFFVSHCFAQPQKKSDAERAEESMEYLRTIYQVFNSLQQRYVEEIDPKILYEGALKGMMDSIGDPYTVYLDVTEMRGLNDTTSGNFYGVGLSISKSNVSTPEKPAYVDVISPIENTPGFKAGIQAGDKIIEINGEPTPEMSMETVLSKLRGPKGEGVEVTVLRGKTVTFKRTLIRDLIEVPTVEYGMIDEIGYARLIQFTPETVDRFQDALDIFAKSGYKGLIIDLRNNPGGLLDSAARIADKFIDEGPLVSTKGRYASETRTIEAHKAATKVEKGVPVVILINRGSASASEILAGALKDNHLAYLVGQRTYGKGSVQQVFGLRENDGVKMTVARYYTPSDTNIDKIGIPPDMEIALSPEYTDEQTKAFIKLSEDGVIRKYVDEHSDLTESQIAAYAVELQKSYDLDLRFLRRLVRVEVSRTKGSVLYDLDYDVQLNAAIDIIRGGKFKTLVKETKTLKELQQEVESKSKDK